MQFNIFDKISKFLNWFIDFIAKPLGIATWSIVLILGAVYYGEYQKDKADLDNKAQITADGLRIKQLENKIDTLSNRLIDRDCSDEVQKYVNLIQTLQVQTSQKKEEIQKRLETERKRTEDLENLNKSLNIK